MQIKRLQIYKMPGFPNGLKPYKQLASNINIITGANGTGKSSTARVIHQLFWKSYRQSDCHAGADINIGGETHSILLNAAGYWHTDQMNRPAPEDFSSVVPPNFAGHYMLALHELVKATDNDLAEMIIEEINGGINLSKAVKQLDYNTAFFSVKRQEVSDYKRAAETYKAKLQEQSSLEHESKNLQELYKKKEQADNAKSRNDFYLRLLEYLKARKQKDEAAVALGKYSPSYEFLQKEDDLFITGWEEKRNTLSKQKETLERENEELTLQLKKSPLLNNNLPNDTVTRLDSLLQSLKDKKKDIESLTDEIVQNEAAKQQLKDFIGSFRSDNDAKPVSDEEINRVGDYARKANDAAFEYNRLAVACEKVEAVVNGYKAEHNLSGNFPGIAVINNGLTELSKWLKEEDIAGYDHKGSFYLLIATGITSLAAAYFFSWFALIGIAIAILILFYDHTQSKQSISAGDSKRIREADYQKLGLENPAGWDSDAVIVMMNRLINLREKTAKLAGQESELTALRSQFNAAKEKYSSIEEEYKELAVSFYPLPDTVINSCDKYNSFYYYIVNLHKWQQASMNLEKAVRLKSAHEESCISLLAEANRILESVCSQQVQDIIGLQSAIQLIKQAIEESRKLITRIDTNRLRLDDNENSMKEASLALVNKYNRLQLQPGDKESVYRLLQGLDNYRQAVREYDSAVSFAENTYNRICTSPFYNEKAIEGMAIEDVELKISETGSEASGYTEIVKKISGIEARVNMQKQSMDVEIALEKKDEALEKLQLLLDKNLQSITGSILASHLKEEVSLQNNNRIFKEAQRILAQITRHRYTLLLNDNENPSFSVTDNDTGMPLSIDELSTGTRIQLLLSVRLAYIRSVEKEIRLPLLADELLANSDDERSEAIIASLAEISKERQVFYFTAQNDEVSKWIEYLERRADISYKLFSLDQGAASYPKASGQIRLKPLHQDIPEPYEMSHAEYGDILNVPTFSLTEQSVNSIHIWYLIDDTQQLCQCLRKGLSTWGRLETAISRTNPEEWGLRVSNIALLRQKAELLASLARLYRIGRPRHIDRGVLQQSGAISDTFMDMAADSLEKSGGDPNLLLGELKGLRNFRDKQAEKLREYLLEHNYIDEKEPLTGEQLHQELTIEANRIGIGLKSADRFIGLFIR